MLDKELRENGPPSTYDNTILTNYTHCPRKLYWFLRRLRVASEPPFFTYGRAFGAGINCWHELQNSDLEFMPRLEESIKNARIEWEKTNPDEDKTNSWENCEQLLRRYSLVYGEKEPWEKLYSSGELGFELPIPGTSVFYGGALDDPIKWKSYGILIREDKTTGMYISPSYLDQWDYSSQVCGYYWAGRQFYEDFFGIYMNIASKRQRKENDMELQFQRLLIKKNDYDLSQFMKDTVLLIDDIRREWDRWEWPKYGFRDPYLCVGGAGKRPCEYKRLCSVEGEPWELEETLDFNGYIWVPKWEPWGREGENE